MGNKIKADPKAVATRLRMEAGGMRSAANHIEDQIHALTKEVHHLRAVAHRLMDRADELSED